MAKDAIVWDTDTNPAREAHIRDTTMYCTSGLWGWMREAWGDGVAAVKTATDPKNGEVILYKADPAEAVAVPVRVRGTGGSAEFSFVRPLRKLDLRIPHSLQFNVTPFARAEAFGTVFVFPLSQRQVVARRVKNAVGFHGQVGTGLLVEDAAPQEPFLPVDE